MKRYSEFAKHTQLEGDKIPIDEILNAEIEVHDFRVGESKYNVGDKLLLTIQIKSEGVNRVIFTGSNVLKSQLEEYKEELPFLAKIIKINNYYSFA